MPNRSRRSWRGFFLPLLYNQSAKSCSGNLILNLNVRLRPSPYPPCAFLAPDSPCAFLAPGGQAPWGFWYSFRAPCTTPPTHQVSRACLSHTPGAAVSRRRATRGGSPECSSAQDAAVSLVRQVRLMWQPSTEEGEDGDNCQESERPSRAAET